MMVTYSLALHKFHVLQGLGAETVIDFSIPQDAMVVPRTLFIPLVKESVQQVFIVNQALLLRCSLRAVMETLMVPKTFTAPQAVALPHQSTLGIIRR
jgi:hypothetical protein